VLQWDVSPLRPWEYWQQPAAEWTEAVAIRSAFNAGIAEFRNSKQAAADRRKRDAEREAELKKRMLG
jgi:hypothetical protein